jgi:hypothetical protein
MDSKQRSKNALQRLVQPHWDIPDALLDAMANLPDFDIRYVTRASKSHSRRYRCDRFGFLAAARALREIAKLQCGLMASRQYRLNVFVAGQMLEYNMVADALEKMAEETPTIERDSHGWSLATEPVGSSQP